MTPHPAVCFAAAVLLGGCGTVTPVADTTPTTITVNVPPIPTVAVVAAPAASSMTAVRLDPPEPDPCGPDAQAHVNGLDYGVHDSAPVREAYRTVGGCIGWTADQLGRWDAFIVDDVIYNESVSCWNVMGGAYGVHDRCEIDVQGRRDDAGWSQLTSDFWYGPGRYGCVTYGTCSAAQVIASPWSSMLNTLWAVMYDGRRPWCFADWARDFHRGCATVPRSWP